ncbi:hypothetical protein C0995_016575 [Termitomyces sp. Mi166|nr:hypothetical protein C0995_016575 [Termitomyces sp. Mi166\
MWALLDLQSPIWGEEDMDFVIPQHILTCFMHVKEDGTTALHVMHAPDPSQPFDLEQIAQYVLIFGWLGLENTWHINKVSYAPTLLASDNSSAALTADSFKADIPKRKGVQTKKKYKPVTLKVKPVAGTVPEDFHVERNIKGDPLADMPPLDPNPPPFIPTGRFTEERKNQFLKEHDTGFLHANELDIFVDLVTKQNQAFTWKVEEKGL